MRALLRGRGQIIASALATAALLFPAGASTPDAEAAARAGLILSGGVPGESFGCSVAGAGDVNGDGYGDVIVGAPKRFLFVGRFGFAFVYLGSADATLVPSSTEDSSASIRACAAKTLPLAIPLADPRKMKAAPSCVWPLL